MQYIDGYGEFAMRRTQQAEKIQCGSKRASHRKSSPTRSPSNSTNHQPESPLGAALEPMKDRFGAFSSLGHTEAQWLTNRWSSGVMQNFLLAYVVAVAAS